jgi:hypothetical protein
MKPDGDFVWLLSHIPPPGAPVIQEAQVIKAEELVGNLIKKKALPYTVGLFGTWGCGKTTFLALLARRLTETSPLRNRCNVLYFNAWKYAGFLEIVPSLIYKVLHRAASLSDDTQRRIARIMLSLGKEYSDRFGQWVERHTGLDPVRLFKDVKGVLDQTASAIPQDVLKSYYTQVDQAQDLLREVFEDTDQVTIVLIDELDRCDPDEAFAVIKQLRVFFAMREVPLLFLICANPEPIGLAIKHRYGLDSPTSDYEAKRILEKFVDTYIDMSEPLQLDAYVKALWKANGKDPADTSFVAAIDERYVEVDYYADTVKNATTFQAMKTDNPIYTNLRLLRKSLEYVCNHSFPNQHLLWSAWHLEMAEQMDQGMRWSIASISSEIRDITYRAYEGLLGLRYQWAGAAGQSPSRIHLDSLKGGTLFGAFRSLYWDMVKKRLDELEGKQGPQAEGARRILREWVSDYRRLDFMVLMSLLPFENFNGQIRYSGQTEIDFKAWLGVLNRSLMDQFGWLLANY